MKVLFATHSLAMGGIETNLVLLTRELTERGVEVVVAARDGVLRPEIERAGGRFVPLRVRLGSPRACIADIRELRALLRGERPDVVHSFAASASLLMRFALGAARPRPFVVSSVMGLQDSPDEAWLVTHARNFALTLGAERILIIAPAIDRMMRRLPIRRSRLVWRPVVGIAPPREEERAAATEARRTLGLSGSDHLVVTIGALAPRKSHGLFIRAAAQVLRARRDVHFVVVGSGPMRSALQAEIDALGVADRVKLLGYQADVFPILRAARVCVKPGILEGFIGITVLEAQARGVPVVAFDTEDVRLAIEDNKTGSIVPAADTAAMAAAILRLIDDPAHADAIARRARESVRAFEIAAIASGLLAFYASRGAIPSQ